MDSRKQITGFKPRSIMKNNTNLINIFEKIYNPYYFKNYQGIPFMEITLEDNTKTVLKINSSETESYFINLGWKNDEKTVSNKNNLLRIKDELNAKCIISNNKKEVNLRAAGSMDRVEIDLCNSNREIVVIEKGKAPFITKDPQNSFMRLLKQSEIPQPVFQELDLEFFKSLFNFEKDSDWLLILAYILKSLTPNSGPSPFLIFEGGQGTGKTTATSIIRRLIDPTEPPVISPPKKEDDIRVQANSSYLMAYDNLSYMTGEIADAFCRVSTGGGMTTRKLYSDDEELVYSIQRPLIFNGIEEISERPDFLDRAILIKTKHLIQKNRKSFSELWDSFKLREKNLVGGVYLLLSKVLEILPSVTHENLPRMSDFARFGIAMEKALNLSNGTFMKIYKSHNEDKVFNAFNSDDLCISIDKLMRSEREWEVSGNYNKLCDSGFVGTANELIDLLKQEEGSFYRSDFSKVGSNLPRTPRQLKARLARVKPLLDLMGIEMFDLPRRSNARNFVITYKDKSLHPKNDLIVDIMLNPSKYQDNTGLSFESIL